MFLPLTLNIRGSFAWQPVSFITCGTMSWKYHKEGAWCLVEGARPYSVGVGSPVWIIRYLPSILFALFGIFRLTMSSLIHSSLCLVHCDFCDPSAL